MPDSSDLFSRIAARVDGEAAQDSLRQAAFLGVQANPDEVSAAQTLGRRRGVPAEIAMDPKLKPGLEYDDKLETLQKQLNDLRMPVREHFMKPEVLSLANDSLGDIRKINDSSDRYSLPGYTPSETQAIIQARSEHDDYKATHNWLEQGRDKLSGGIGTTLDALLGGVTEGAKTMLENSGKMALVPGIGLPFAAIKAFDVTNPLRTEDVPTPGEPGAFTSHLTPGSIAESKQAVDGQGALSTVLAGKAEGFGKWLKTPIIEGPKQYLTDPESGKLFANPDYSMWGQGFANQITAIPGTMAKLALLGGAAVPEMGWEAAKGRLEQELKDGSSYPVALAKALGAGAATTAVLMVGGHLGKGAFDTTLPTEAAYDAPAGSALKLLGATAGTAVKRGVAMQAGFQGIENLTNLGQPFSLRDELQKFATGSANMTTFELAGAIQPTVDGLQHLKSMSRVAEQSALFKRSKDAWVEGTAKVLEGKPDEFVIIPKQDFVTFYQSEHGDSPSQAAKAMGVANFDQLKPADELKIRTADYIANTPGKVFDGLHEVARFSDSQVSPRDIQKAVIENLTNNQQRANQLATEAGLDAKLTDSERSTPEWQQIANDTTEKLANVFNPSTARTYAEWHADTMTNLAKRFGQQSLELHDRYQLSVGRYVDAKLQDEKENLTDEKHLTLHQAVLAEGEAAKKEMEADRPGFMSRLQEALHGSRIPKNMVDGDAIAEVISPSVKANPLHGHYSSIEHGIGEQVSSHYYRHLLGQPVVDGKDRVLIVLGMAGSGKTTEARHAASDFHTVITMTGSDPAKIKAAVDAAQNAKLGVDLTYVHVPLDEAVRRNVDRYSEDGRAVRVSDQIGHARDIPAAIFDFATSGDYTDVNFKLKEKTQAGRERGDLHGGDALDELSKIQGAANSEDLPMQAAGAYTYALGGLRGRSTEGARTLFESGLEEAIARVKSPGQLSGWEGAVDALNRRDSRARRGYAPRLLDGQVVERGYSRILTPAVEDNFVAARLGRAGDAEARSHEGTSPAAADRLRHVIQFFEPTPEQADVLEKSGLPALRVEEWAPKDEAGELTGKAAEFRGLLEAIKNDPNPKNKFGAAVYLYDQADYEGMRLFVSDDRKSGFALKADGDIVSVFSGGGGAAMDLVSLAIEQGGMKLDCFDTVLPEIYSANGFKVATREPWNETYMPAGWNKQTFYEFNRGEPDVVYMTHDASYNPFGEQVDPNTLNQSVTLRDGRETLVKYGLDPNKSYSVREVAAALEARQQKKYGAIDPTDRSPESAKKIAKWMAEEVAFEQLHPEASGVGWYSEKFQRALDVFSDEFPELKSDKNSRDLLTALIAVTSDGQSVIPNFQQAVDLYGNFRKTGEFTSERSHNRQASIDNNLATIGKLLKELGPDGMRTELLQEATVSELKKIAAAKGISFSTDYQAHIKLPMAAIVFGPKLGAFYANLMGAEGYLTMDRWWSRTFNRYRGDLLPEPTQQGLTRLKGLLGNPDMTDEQAMEATKPLRKSYEAKGFKEGTELEKAGNTIWKAAFGELNDSPNNASDRTFMLDAVAEARKALKRKGIKMSVADIQATLWYYEKRLYGELGARQSQDVSYEEAAHRVIESRAGNDQPGGRTPQGDGGAEAEAGAGGVPEQAFESGAAGGVATLHQPERGFITFGAGNKISIGLLEGADLSTLTHELAHAYFKIVTDLASAPGAPPAEVAAYGKLLEWLGAKPGEPLTREQQEQLARGEEAYVHEGKAPSAELKHTFARLSTWMRMVYGETTEDLGVKLTPEVRDFFDRLHASDDAIEKTKASVAAEPLFHTAESMGVNPKLFELYANAAGSQIQEGKEALQQKLIRQGVRNQKAWWKQEHAALTEEARAALDNRPDFRAAKALTEGVLKHTTEDGTVIEIPVKLDYQAMVDQYGKAAVKALPAGVKRMLGEGMDAEGAAEALGFESGDALLEAMKALPNKDALAKESADKAMAEKHGDMMLDGSITDAAVDALVNDSRGQVLHLELAALKKKAREAKPYINNATQEQKNNLKDAEALRKEQLQNATQEQKNQLKVEGQIDKKELEDALDIPPLQTFRDRAVDIMSSMTIREIKPLDYLTESRRSSRQAYEAMGRNNYEAAAAAKQAELLSHFLYRAAMDVRDRAKVSAEFGIRMGKTEAQKLLGKADPSPAQTYLTQMNSILERFGFRPDTNLAASKKQSLLEWAQVQLDQGLIPAIDPRILNEARKTNFRDLNIDELEAVKDAMINIHHLAKMQSETLRDGRRVDFGEQVAGAEATKARRKHPDHYSGYVPQGAEKLTGFARGFDALNLKMAVLFDKLDGGDVNGFWRGNILDPLRDATTRKHDLTTEYTGKMQALLEQLPQKTVDSLLDRFPVAGFREPITKQQILSMAFNMGNMENYLMLTNEKYNFTEDQVNAAVAHLSREEWAFVQGAWDVMETMRPLIGDLERRMTGLEPKWVEPRGFSITTKDGQKIDLKGGYAPLVADSRGKVGEKMQPGPESLMEEGYTRIGTSHGFTKERSGAQYQLDLNFKNMLTKHLDGVCKDLAFREAVVNVNRFISDETVRKTMREVFGAEYEKQLKPWLRSIVNDQNGATQQGLSWLERGANGIRSRTVNAMVAYKFASAAVQVMDFSRILPMVHPKHLTNGLVEFSRNPQAAIDFARESSPLMKHRVANLDRDIREKMQNMLGDTSNMAKFNRAGYAAFGVMDTVVSVPSWLGAYREGLAKHDNNHNLAVKEADRVIELTLQSGEAMDLVGMQRNSPYLKLFSMFAGDGVSCYNLVRHLGNNVTDVGSAAKLGGAVLLTMVTANILADLISGRGPREDQGEDWPTWLARQAVLGPLRSFPVIRDVATALDTKMFGSGFGNYRWSPVFSGMEAVANGVVAQKRFFVDDGSLDSWLWDTGTAAGYAFGVSGTTQATKSGKYIEALIDGEEPVSHNPLELAWRTATGAKHQQ